MRKVEPQLRVGERAGSMVGVWRHFNAARQAPLLAHRLKSCPPGGRDARARENQFDGRPTRRLKVLYRLRTPIDQRDYSLSLRPLPSLLSTLLVLHFTHTQPRIIPLACRFHRTIPAFCHGETHSEMIWWDGKRKRTRVMEKYALFPFLVLFCAFVFFYSYFSMR